MCDMTKTVFQMGGQKMAYSTNAIEMNGSLSCVELEKRWVNLEPYITTFTPEIGDRPSNYSKGKHLKKTRKNF